MKNENVIAVYGASGFGKEVIPLVKSVYSSDYDLVFIDDNFDGLNLNDYKVFKYEEFINTNHCKKYAVIAIADANVRKALADKLTSDGIEHLDIHSKNSVLLDSNKIGKGSILCPFTTITSNVQIGDFFHANLYSYVAHDCVIGDYVTFAPSVKCNGNVVVEDFAYIGTGAVIKQGTPKRPIVIGEGAVVGMGAVVTKSVKAGDIVFGNPAKSLKRGKS
ncbi:acetyltransferase [Vibrio splendidus]